MSAGWRAAALLLTALAALSGVSACAGDEAGRAAPALGTERVRRASGIEVRPDERVLWGNLVVRTTRDTPVELKRVRLIEASERITVRRALVADGRRPQDRLLVFGERAFEELPTYEAWQRSLHPLTGYEVEPGQARDTEIVLELEPLGRGAAAVEGGVRVTYEAEGRTATLDLPNQLGVCAPSPCRPPPPTG